MKRGADAAQHQVRRWSTQVWTWPSDWLLLLSSVLTQWLHRWFLLGRQRGRDPRRDPGPGDAHRSSRSPRRPRRWWRGHGGHGGGHPGHRGPPVWGLHRAALRPHSHLLPRPLRLPHVVGGRLPGHQLPVWHLLPPVPHGELTEQSAATSVLGESSGTGTRNQQGTGVTNTDAAWITPTSPETEPGSVSSWTLPTDVFSCRKTSQSQRLAPSFALRPLSDAVWCRRWCVPWRVLYRGRSSIPSVLTGQEFCSRTCPVDSSCSSPPPHLLQDPSAESFPTVFHIFCFNGLKKAAWKLFNREDELLVFLCIFMCFIFPRGFFSFKEPIQVC